MSFYFYANIEGKRVDKLRVHNKKGSILSHFGLMPDREPEPQVSCPFFFCHAVISCRNVLRHIMLGKTWQYLLCCLFHYGRL